MSFIKNLLSAADKGAPEAMPQPVATYAPLVGVDPYALLKSAEQARDNATRRATLLMAERDRIDGELAKTDLSIKATMACIDALSSLVVGNLDRELADMVLGNNVTWTSEMQEDNENDKSL